MVERFGKDKPGLLSCKVGDLKSLKKPRSFGFFFGNFSEVFLLRVPV